MKDEQIEALHPVTADLVDRFASALKDKLHASQIKYGWQDDWTADDWQERCQTSLLEHLVKGDPRDVAAFAAFMWHHGWPTASLSQQEAPEQGLVAELRKLRSEMAIRFSGTFAENALNTLDAAEAALSTDHVRQEALEEAKRAADGILAPLCEKVGRFMIEEPERDAVATMADYDVVIPFSRFQELYDATDESTLANNGGPA
tara:strand:+ start:4125 stop:4733 length:609 start_codon:yes stop_codon:yes gene_type:complete